MSIKEQRIEALEMSLERTRQACAAVHTAITLSEESSIWADLNNVVYLLTRLVNEECKDNARDKIEEENGNE